VAASPKQVSDSEVPKPLKSVVRKAKPEDIKRAQEFEDREKETLTECGKLINELHLPMKLLSAEYNLDGSRLTFFFSAAERVDFRELVRELSKRLKVRVELRQVGSRDESKLIGGFGRCGRPLCCMSFLSEFSPVSIRMAKEQGLSLNPMRISGVCGRLLCCLGYECEQYRVMKAKLPKEGQRVSVPMGIAKVVGGNPLKETVLVELESRARVELPLSEVTIIDH
jgi:cell fate regulator YaaT (PSP1 superfamily)